MNIVEFLCIFGLIAERFMFGYCTKSFAEDTDVRHGFAWGFLLGAIGLIIVAIMITFPKQKGSAT